MGKYLSYSGLSTFLDLLKTTLRGHTIQDKSGTDLADQNTLQFAGYQNVTNDSTNGKTVVDNTPTTITWANYQSLTSEQRQGNHYIITDIPSGGGSVGGGHVIEDDSGADMPQEENLQFVGAYTEDDATNDRTKVNIVRPMTKEQYEALTPAQKKGFIRTTDEPDNPYQHTNASDVDYDNSQSGLSADKVQGAIDKLATNVIGSVTLEEDFTFVTGHLIKRGNLCELNYTLRGTVSTLNTWVKVGTVSFPPRLSMYLTWYDGDDGTILCTGRIADTGELYIRPSTSFSNKYLVVHTVYMTTS